ncbi:DUF4192 domain-containing protein [Aeromicrobium sp. CF3.5]|uniref:DUF4192 domain-containing protein n=1 Tax=Aeromicrobium sp. CF3.5 TaxID=3373078 RepID=UPI003EE47EAF
MTPRPWPRGLPGANVEGMTHDDRPVFTAHDIPDLFNAMPTLFGFRPVESIVAIATSGPRHRMGFRLRMDLPGAEYVDDAAAVIVGHLRRQGAEGVIALAITRRQRIAHDLLEAIEAQLGTITPIVIARSNGQRYWVDIPGFPAEGIGYDTSDHHVSIVQAVAAGQQVLPDRETLVARFAPVAGECRDRMEVLTHAALVRVLGDLGRHDEPSDVVALRELGPLVSRVAAGEPVTEEDAAAVSVWVNAINVRDALWELFTPDVAEASFALMSRAAQLVVPPYEPGVLALTAFTAWLTGDGAQALIAAERAHAADPAYSMATLMLDLVQSGIGPQEWADREDLRQAG